MNNNKSGSDLTIAALPIWIFIIPPAMLILAPIFPWPHGYYQLLRLIVCLTAGIITFSEYRANNKNLAVCAALVALIFNPLVKVDFDESVWAILDFGIAGAWIYFLWRKDLKLNQIALIFGVPVGLIILLFGLATLDQIQRKHKEKIRGEQLYKEWQLKNRKEIESKERLEKEKQITKDAEERELVENANKVAVVKFDVKPNPGFVSGTVSNISLQLVLNNTNDYPIIIEEATVYFIDSDGSLLENQKLDNRTVLFANVHVGGEGWHKLRRTYGSRLVQEGVDIYKISRWMGHSSVKVTEKHYAEFAPKYDRDIEKLSLNHQDTNGLLENFWS